MIIDPQNKLNDLNDFAKPIFIEFLTRIQTELYLDVKINGVYYNYTDSLKLHQTDSRNPEYNFHEFGIAVDLNIIKDKRSYLKNDPIDDWILTGVPEIAKELGLRWGGLFNGYPDCIHFDIASKINPDVFKALDMMVLLAREKYVNLNTAPLNKLNLISLFS